LRCEKARGDDAGVGIPEIRYAATPDGINIAVSGSGCCFEDVSELELKGVPDLGTSIAW
jgi:hypothetical protein